jgi:hypothetical protein
MKKDFIYWLRWITVIPGALIFGFLATFPLHWFLYLGEPILGFLELSPETKISIEYTLTPFVVAIVFILAGFEIAPKYKFQTSMILTILHVSFVISVIIFMSGHLEKRGILGLLGSFLGLYITWRKFRVAPLIIPTTEVTEINDVTEVKKADRMTTDIAECFDCKYFIDNINFTCKGFPEGIPKNILLSEIKHNHKIEGQTGEYIFEPEEGYERETL